MKIIGLIICLILFAAQQIVVERATDEETRQVREVTDAFERRMRETRDVSSINDLFLNDFARLQIEQEKRPNQPLVLIPSIPLSIESELINQVTAQEWRRFYAANLNLRYYFVLLIASRTKPGEIENTNNDFTRRLFPAEVLTLLNADPFLNGQYGPQRDQTKYKIETLQELRSLITTLEQATLILRQRFLKNPPEQTRTYQENLRNAPTKDTAQPISPSVSVASESRLGLPVGTRFFSRLTSDSLFELSLVKTGNGMKIVSARVYPFN